MDRLYHFWTFEAKDLMQFFLLQMEEFLAGKGEYKMPPAEGQDTIFEYLVNEQGEWEHWSERVGVVRCLCFTKD